MNIMEDLGVQSYALRGFKTNQQVADKIKELGLSKVEICGVHADFSEEDNFDKTIAVYKNAGVDIACIGVESFGADAKAAESRFKFAKLAGAKVISADFDLDTVPDCYRTVEQLGDKYDINVAIHNHGAQHWLGSGRMLRHVFANTNKRIGLHMDTAWALDSREDPVAMAKEFHERLYGLHIKDFVFDRASQPEDVVVGEGNLKLKELMTTLKEQNFNGPMILEYEGDVDNPIPALKKCVQAICEAAG